MKIKDLDFIKPSDLPKLRDFSKMEIDAFIDRMKEN